MLLMMVAGFWSWYMPFRMTSPLAASSPGTH
jgi:hypothetical protein